MKKITFLKAVAIIVVLGSLSLSYGCKKESSMIKSSHSTTPKMREISDEDESAILENIDAFYDQMVALHGTGEPSEISISIDSAEFIMEATYNALAVHADTSSDEEMVIGVNAQVTPNESGEVSLDQLAEAFYSIKDNILDVYDTVSYDYKRLHSVDFQIDENGEIQVAVGIIKGGIIGGGCTKTFTTATNHAYYIPTLGWWPNVVYGKGQCDLDMTNKTIMSNTQNNTLWGAAASLRNYGIGNYWQCTGIACGFYVNLTTAHVYGSPTVSSPTCSYVSASVPGYQNNTIWHTWMFFSSTSVNATVSDPDLVFKEWLTTPMMNFYLSYIPGYISANVPTGKKLADFNIDWNFCLCAPTAANTTTNPWNWPALQYSYWYHITSGYYIVGCDKYIGISAM